MATATIRVPGLKVTVPLSAEACPATWCRWTGRPASRCSRWCSRARPSSARAKLNGKNYRKLLKQVAEVGAANMSVVLQGNLRPPAAPGGPFVLDSAGFQANVKAPPAVGAAAGLSRRPWRRRPTRRARPGSLRDPGRAAGRC